MKFLADMGISPLIVKRLKEEGHDAIHLSEQGLMRSACPVSRGTRGARAIANSTDLEPSVSGSKSNSRRPSKYLEMKQIYSYIHRLIQSVSC